MKASEIRVKTDKELEELKIGFFREAFNLQMQKATGQLNKSEIGRASCRERVFFDV
jgi:ribosomal protein L29